jgi:hypothetical protein
VVKQKPDSTAGANAGPGETGDVEAAQAAATASDSGTKRVTKDDYTTNGKTKVATPRGYAFESADQSIPVIDHEGIRVTAEQAATLIEESSKLVLVVEDEKEGDNA